MDRVFLQEFSSRQGLSYDLVCFPFLISFMSTCTLFVSKSSMSLVLSAFLWLLLMAFLEVKQWNNKRVLRYWYFRLFMVTCICNRLDHLCGYRNMMWDNGIIGMKWNQRYSGLVVRRSRMLSSLGLKNVLVQWWQMQLGVLGFVILATVINDCPINQLLFFYHYIVGIKWNVLVLVCCHLGRVRPILLIYAQCSERFWFTGYGFAGFFLGISWGVWTILLYVKRCGSVVCLWYHQTMIRYNLDGEDQIMIPVR